VREERVILEHDANVALERRQAGDRAASQEDFARARREKAGDQPERSGLAAARGPEQGQEFAVAHFEVDARNRDGRAVALLDTGKAQRRLRHARAAHR